MENNNSIHRDPKTREAYIFFGGVSSGKTTLAQIIEAEGTADVMYMDEFIYKSNILKRDYNTRTSSVHKKKNIIEKHPRPLLVCDFMPQKNLIILDIINRTHKTITAIFLNITRDERYARFLERHEKQIEILDKLFKLLNITYLTKEDVRDITKKERLDKIFKDINLYKRIPAELKEEYDKLLKEFYLSGSRQFFEESPNPITFDNINYVVEFNDNDYLPSIRLADICSKKIPFEEFENSFKNKEI